MNKKITKITSLTIEHSFSFNFTELAEVTHLPPETLMEMIEHGLLSVQGKKVSNWRFDELGLKRTQKAANLYYDLEVNVPGVLLALELLEQLEDLQKEVAVLRQIHRF